MIDPAGAPAAHFLIVGDSTDLPTIVAMLRRLPTLAYGQVYVEVASPAQIRPLPAPPSLAVTWLCRDRTGGAGTPIAPRGELAARAIAAWMTEWMPNGDTTTGPHVMWLGCAASEPVARLARELDARIGPSRIRPDR